MLSNTMMLAQKISERQLSVHLLQQRLPVMPFSPRGVDLISCILSFIPSNAARLSISSKISIVGLALLYYRYDESPLTHQPISRVVSALHLDSIPEIIALDRDAAAAISCFSNDDRT
ncbi:hypothetical protein [Serratia nevei]|uniref:hypothetical protein n=1 Tax=Serratia nevei TaxID=2703794 RepID=UPI0030180F46